MQTLMSDRCGQSAIHRPSISKALKQNLRASAKFLGPIRSCHGFAAVGQMPLFSSGSQLLGKSLLWRHPTLYASLQYFLRDTKLSRPFRERHSSVLVGDKMVIPFVVSLFESDSPSAIFGRVWAIVVNAINGMLWRWARPHVSVKVLERVDPASAHCNTARAIVRIIRRFGICASALDMPPTSVLGRVSHAVRRSRFGCGLWTKATATLGAARLQIVAKGNLLISAIANAAPRHVAVRMAASIGYHNKSAKALASDVLNMLIRKWRSVNMYHVPHDTIDYLSAQIVIVTEAVA